MSKSNTSERKFMRRTMLISILAVLLFSALIALMALRYGSMALLLDFLGPVITGVLAILLLTLTFIGLLVFFGNLREWYGETAGWFEIILLWIIVVVIAGVGFGLFHAVLTGLLCIGVIYYIHIAQD